MKQTIPMDDMILVLLAVVFAPHVVRIPLWISFFCTFSWGAACILRHKGKQLLPRFVIIILALGCTAGALFSFSGSLGREAGIGLLSLMLALKPLETHSDRDRMVTLFLAYFLILTNILYSQSLVMAAYMIVCVILACMIQIRLHDTHGGAREHLRKSCVLLGQALPLALVLFVLFPRISGSLWGFKDPQPSGVTGLSTTLSPGRISSLSLSRAIAFRVRFEDSRIPGRDDLYWRVLVLSRFNGREWSVGEGRTVQRVELPEGPSLRYTVTAEPSGQTWMYGLDLPLEGPPGVVYTNEYTLSAPVKITKRVRYTLSSCFGCRNTLAGSREEFLALPDSGGEKARELAISWKKDGQSARDVVARALSYFRTNAFYYTLNPPRLAMDTPVEDFLFNVRKGYCEHYASAFTFLMRAAGIPARVVVGYQGGESNPVDNYLIVRQSDAHAWSEVWLADEGWTRIDPTAAVSPLRIEQGAEAVVSREVGTLFEVPAMGAVRWAWNQVRFNWDALNNVWNQWVLDYSAKRQKKILEFLGLARTWKGISTGIVLSVVAVLGFGIGILLYLRRPARIPRDKVAVIYERFLQKTAAWPNTLGVPPVSYMNDLRQKIPDYAEEIGKIRDVYIVLRYTPRGEGHDQFLQEFRKRVNSLKKIKKKG